LLTKSLAFLAVLGDLGELKKLFLRFLYTYSR